MQGMVAGKRSRGKPRQIGEKYIRYIVSVRWQQQVEWQMTGTDFSKTFGQREQETREGTKVSYDNDAIA